MQKRIEVWFPHDSQRGNAPPTLGKKRDGDNIPLLVEPQKEDWRIELMKKELDEMRFIRSGADIALIIVERPPAGDLIYCADTTLSSKSPL